MISILDFKCEPVQRDGKKKANKDVFLSFTKFKKIPKEAMENSEEYQNLNVDHLLFPTRASISK